MILRSQWYCPQVNVTWLHHWWVNIGLDNDLVSSGNKPLPWPMFSKICMSLSRSQRVNIFTDSRWTDWFLSRSLHGIQLNFQKTKISGSTSIIHLSYVTVSDRYLINVDEIARCRQVYLHRPRLGAPVSPICFADHAVKQSGCTRLVTLLCRSATPGSQWHKTMLGQSHHGINSYKGRHKPW